MSKKLIAILFCIILCLCLAFSACGEKPDGDKTGDNESSTGQGDGDGSEESTGDNESDTEQGDSDGSEESEEITEMYIYVGDNRLAVTLAENSAVDALIEILKKGDITYTSHANGFEIYGDIGHNLGTDNNAQMTSEAGDVLLYIGSNICIFFDSNSWSYTRIGKIEGYTASQLKSILAPSSTVQVTISLK